MKFLFDMGISPETGLYLTKLGYDAVHLIDEGMDRGSDDQIMVKALQKTAGGRPLRRKSLQVRVSGSTL